MSIYIYMYVYKVISIFLIFGNVLLLGFWLGVGGSDGGITRGKRLGSQLLGCSGHGLSLLLSTAFLDC